MSTKDSIEAERNVLERRANAVRSRLLMAVDALDARRHRVEEVGARAKDVAGKVLVSAAGILAVLGVAGIGLGWYLAQRRRRRLPERIRAGIRSLDLVRPPPLRRKIAEKLAMTLVSVLAGAIAKRAAHEIVTPRGQRGLIEPDVSISPHPGPRILGV